MINLLTNAVHAIEARPGLGVVHVEAHARDGRAVVHVKDDGVGIEPSRLQTVFQPGESSRPGAPGLGLAIVRRLVEACGGSIRAMSAPGEGTSFVLDLPLAAEV